MAGCRAVSERTHTRVGHVPTRIVVRQLLLKPLAMTLRATITLGAEGGKWERSSSARKTPQGYADGDSGPQSDVTGRNPLNTSSVKCNVKVLDRVQFGGWVQHSPGASLSQHIRTVSSHNHRGYR